MKAVKAEGRKWKDMTGIGAKSDQANGSVSYVPHFRTSAQRALQPLFQSSKSSGGEVRNGRNFLLVVGFFVSLFRGNPQVAQVVHDGVVERLVTLLLADLDHTGNLVRLALADEVGDGAVEHENLQRRHAAGLVDAAEKILRDDAL